MNEKRINELAMMLYQGICSYKQYYKNEMTDADVLIAVDKLQIKLSSELEEERDESNDPPEGV